MLRSMRLATVTLTMSLAATLLAACSGASASIGPDPEIADAAAPPPMDATTPVTTTMTPDAQVPPSIDAGDCPALTYPSGVVIQSFPNAAMTATYAHHLGTGEDAPTCFLDAENLINPMTGEVYPVTVNVAADFQLEDLVGTEINQGYGHIVLMKPEAVASLQKFRDDSGKAVDVISGFRSPKHQEDTCNDLCGEPLGCSGTCANNSRHMFGDAFDLPLSFYTTAYEDLACSDGFKFAYKESGTHLHVDQNPEYATCVKE